MLKGYNKYTVASAAVKRKNFIEKSDLLGNNNSSLTAGNAILPDMDNDLLEGLIQYDDPKVVYKMYRDVYYHDAIAGTAVDIQSNMPFGEFSLTGINNKDMMNTFENSIANLRLKSLMPNLTRDYMVMGAHISIPIFDSNKRIYTSLIPINIELCDFKPTPFFGDDPLIDVKLSKTLKDYISNNDPRMKRIARSFPKWFIEGINRGKILLDPQNVLYIPRRVFSTSSMGTSYLRRILPIFLLEKALLRGTIDQAYKRQRPIGLVKAGDDDWEPTNDEFSNLVNLFQMADMDPVGAIIGIPNTVTYEEVRTGSDFWKIEDIHSAYTQEVKYKALGISEALLSSEVNFATIEQSLSFFIEQIKYYREDVTREIYYERLFPTLSVVNDYRKDGRSNTILANITKEELETYNTIGRNKYSFFKDGKFVVHCNDKVRLQEIDDINQYIIPKINWHKRLEPRADREYIDILNEMTEKGLPIPLRMLAASAGLSLDDILEASDTDIKDREKIGDIMEEINDINKKAGVNSNEEENNYGDNYASINTKNKKMIKNRDFTNISKINKNNKYKEDRINKDIAKAKSRINKLEMQKENMNNVRKREYSFKSRLGL